MDDVDGEERMQFSTDPDFEGGQWIDGEFFYRAKRQKQRQTKVDVIYGVFQDVSDEEEDDDDLTGGAAGRRRRKRRGDKEMLSKTDLTKPVAFVSKGTVNPSLDEEQKPKQAEGEKEELEDEMEEERPAGAGFGFGATAGLGSRVGSSAGSTKQSGFVSGGVSRKEEQDAEENLLPTAFGQRIKERAEKRREAEKERKLQERQEQARREGRAVKTSAGTEIGTFEKHTKGIGLKLLQKMGYKGGGLGRNAQGIEKPIEAKMRPQKMGMGFNDFKEKEVGLPPPPGKEGAGAEEEGRPSVSVTVEEGRAQEKLWKKRHAGRRVAYKTAAQLLEEKEAAQVTQTVVDMRGEQVRVLTDLSAINAEQRLADDDTPMPELQHNVRLTVDLAEAAILATNRKLQAERDTLAALQAHREQALASERRAAQQLSSLLELLQALEALPEPSAALAGQGPTAFPPAASGPADRMGAEGQAALALFLRLRQQRAEEYAMFSVALIALSHALAHLSPLFRLWDPLAAPAHGLLAVSSWRPVLARSADKDDRAIFADVEAGDLAQGYLAGGAANGTAAAARGGAPSESDPYTRLIGELLLPPLRAAVVNRWEPREPEALLRFFEAWQPPALPSVVQRALLESLVLPKLQAAVEAWDPRRETIPIHQWLHPWLPLLGSAMQGLYPTIRQRLAACLTAWHPSDASAHMMLAPWHKVFDETSWDAMVARSIVPRLIAMLQSEFVVNPQAQQLEPFQWAMAWSDVLPPRFLVALLDVGFFPQWHQVLFRWLSSSPNFDEVTRWYLGWKALLPPALLSHERVRLQLNAALEMMNRAVEGMPVAEPGARENVSYLRASEQQAFLGPQQRGGGAGGTQAEGAGGLEEEEDEEEGAGGRSRKGKGRATAALDDRDLTLKEAVESFALAHDVRFVPKPGRMREGLPVYQFGSVSVVVDAPRQLLLAQSEAGGWEAVGLQELLERHRKKGGRWA